MTALRQLGRDGGVELSLMALDRCLKESEDGSLPLAQRGWALKAAQWAAASAWQLAYDDENAHRVLQASRLTAV